MGEVKRYVPEHGADMDVSPSDPRDIRLRVQYVDHSDYARLERERDHYKAFHDETMPVLEAAQGLRNRLESTERAMAAQASELSRLRAVEAAAKKTEHALLLHCAMLRHHQYGWLADAVEKIREPLAEACGRKG